MNIRYTAISYPGVDKYNQTANKQATTKNPKHLTFFYYYPSFLNA